MRFRFISIPQCVGVARCSRRVRSRPAKLVCVRSGRTEAPVIFLNAPLGVCPHGKPDEPPENHAHSILSEVPFRKSAVEAAMRFETDQSRRLEEMVGRTYRAHSSQ